jgi:16S rRNA (cytosine1402-N4)-methyltransferase
MHTPVLLKEVIESLDIKPGKKYIDATVGEAGHMSKIIELGGEVLGIDMDPQQIKNIKDAKVVAGNFADIEEIARANNFFPVDGVLFDLGLSMRQIRESGRGFSYQNLDEPLDMRIDVKNEQTSADLINSLSNDELYEIFAKYSEEIHSRAIADTVYESRKLGKFETVGDLVAAIDEAIGRSEKRVYSRIFQALRIAVNNEFENMKKGLKGAHDILSKNGRIAVITFHSLEDRIVKNFIKEKGLRMLTRKPIRADGDAQFERSAKLRIILKK